MANKPSSSSASSSFVENATLAQLLRECATLVERNEHSVLLYKAVEALNHYAESNGHTPASSPTATSMTRPSFQRPINQKSNLIANGWIEQIRRSKFRTVWKEVLASLVEARQPGEETTLWIQRETVGKASNGNGTGTTTTLEAIHQIPMKWLLDVRLLDFYGDFRFAIKVYNVPEDFVFRTRDEESCREWVATLISAKESSNSKRATEAAAEANFPDLLGQGESPPPLLHETKKTASSDSHHGIHGGKQHEFPDLDWKTGNPAPTAPPMDRGNLGSGPSHYNNHNNSTSSSSHSSHAKMNGKDTTATASGVGGGATATVPLSKDRMSIKELRAIAHGAGYDTRGMERSDLEKIAAYYAPVSEKTAQLKKQQQQQQQSHQQQNQQQQRAKQETPSPSQVELEQKRKAEEAERLRKEMENERLRKQQEYVAEKRREARQREEEVKKQNEARRKEEDTRRWQQQQQQQQQRPSNGAAQPNAFGASSASSSPRRTHPVQSMFESTRFFNYDVKSGESGPRRKQPFPSHAPHSQPQQPQPQPSQQHPQQTYAPPPDPPAAPAAPPQYNHYHHQQQQQQPRPAPPQPPPNTNQQRTCDPTSPLNQKYAKVMATNQPASSTQDDEAAITNIKRNVLIAWALVPPQYNMLRPIDQLLSSIHTVFPPFANVASHDYFSKWKPIAHSDLLIGSAMSGADEAKLKKAVRKLRVFLHPDKLPKELDSKQSFVCKMLWDVSNDAYEEFLKSKEDLDWIGS